MFQDLLMRVRREVSGGRALDTVRTLARHHRVQASPGYDAASEWLASRLEAFGLGVEIEHVPGDGRTRLLGALMPQGWECRRGEVWLVDGAARERLCEYDAEPLSLILRSAPVRGRFPVITLDDGTEPAHYDGRDVRGRVVLTRGAVHRVHQLAVIERGAAGLLYDGRRLLPPVRDAFDDPDALTYTSFWWNGDAPRGWGAVVSPRRGAALRARLAAGADLELDVTIESRAFDTAIPLLSGCLGDPAAPDGEVLVIAHLCHPRPSANDNASGVAAALEAARALAALEARGEWSPGRRSVRFLWVPELTGTFAWFGRDRARAARTVAALNLDMVGEDQAQCGSTQLLEHPPHFAASFAEPLLALIRDAAVDWVTSYSGAGHYALMRTAEVPYSGGSDHAVLVDPAIGVPCPMLIQWPDRFYHTSHDTPDKCDPGSLAHAARTAATYAGWLATAGEREGRWLGDATARTLKRDLLATVDRDPSAIHRVRARAAPTFRSLERLGAGPGHARAAIDDFERFVAREVGDMMPPPALPGGAAARIPVRAIGAPLEHQAHLLPGWAAWTPAERDAWRALADTVPGGATALEVAWFACDGARSLGEIARLVALETRATTTAETLLGFFEATARMGASRWRESGA